jgi:MoxR-like ATPase|tara:strand:- start:35 stop:1198 length:1164 start_codon:yes stop_codon:yes gene_type:complete
MNKAIEKLMNDYPNQVHFSTSEIKKAAKDIGENPRSAYTFIKYRENCPQISRGVYDLTSLMPKSATPKKDAAMSYASTTAVASVSNDEVFVPNFDDTFVAWGNFTELLKIVRSRMFYPTFVSGLSGNGKTFMIEQACAKLKREYVRVQISPETDEDDLIGGFRLIKGETVFQKGPVIKAMEAGAILMIDEIDRGTNKIMCLQGVLEGKPVLIKKTGQVIEPKEGFNIIATANTKGKGSEDGRYSAAGIIDDAFLERFTITLEQTFPTMPTEEKIVMKHMKKFEVMDEEFAKLLVGWADAIRKTFYDEGIDEVISTRRLCHIVQTFSIFNKREKAIALCVNRFDEDTKAAFIDLYEKVDATINNPEPEVEIDLGDGDPHYDYSDSDDV